VTIRNAVVEIDERSDYGKERLVRTAMVVIRHALNLSQQEFAEVFGISIGTLRDWEHELRPPDQAAQSYLKVIARDPNAVRKSIIDRCAVASTAKIVRSYLNPRRHRRGNPAAVTRL
jgi:DNA-binding transcriptional regulator YiaG